MLYSSRSYYIDTCVNRAIATHGYNDAGLTNVTGNTMCLPRANNKIVTRKTEKKLTIFLLGLASKNGRIEISTFFSMLGDTTSSP